MLALQERCRCPLRVFEFANRADVAVSLVCMRSRLFPFFLFCLACLDESGAIGVKIWENFGMEILNLQCYDLLMSKG